MISCGGALADGAAVPPTAHLVTLSTHRRRFVLRGDGHDIVSEALMLLPHRHPGLEVDCALVLPDRLFAIVRLPNASALTPLVQAYKASTTRTLKMRIAIDRVWEKGFEHREIRDEAELIAVRAMLRTYEQR
jgi:hypothetical protein